MNTINWLLNRTTSSLFRRHPPTCKWTHGHRGNQKFVGASLCLGRGYIGIRISRNAVVHQDDVCYKEQESVKTLKTVPKGSSEIACCRSIHFPHAQPKVLLHFSLEKLLCYLFTNQNRSVVQIYMHYNFTVTFYPEKASMIHCVSSFVIICDSLKFNKM
jgi:hypothetical protein